MRTLLHGMKYISVTALGLIAFFLISAGFGYFYHHHPMMAMIVGLVLTFLGLSLLVGFISEEI